MKKYDFTFIEELVEELTDAAADFGSALALDSKDLKRYESDLNKASEKLLSAIKTIAKGK